MKAFLLAAGKGTRLRPLTNKIPKCLLPIDGKPLLQLWLELLGWHGIEEVLINTHWLHKQVRDFITNAFPVGGGDKEAIKKWPRVHLSYEQELLGSGGTLLANKEFVEDEPFFILYGDNLTNVDLTSMNSFHNGHPYPFTLGVFRANEPRRCGIVQVNDHGVVETFTEKPDNPASNLAAAGIYIAEKKIFEFFPENEQIFDLGFDVFPELVGKMQAYIVEDFLMDIGTKQSYEEAQRLWKKEIKEKAARKE